MEGFGRLVMDSGSSTLGFCPPPGGVDKPHGDLAYCAAYGGGAWWGWAYSETVSIKSDEVDGTLQIPGASYGIMEAHGGPLFCQKGSDGIIGIGFEELSTAGHIDPGTPLPTDDANVSQWRDFCYNDRFKKGTPEVPPLLHKLNGKKTPELIGIYWTGEQGDNQGTLYLDEAAHNNIHYAPDADAPMKAGLTEIGYYGINIISITVGDKFAYEVLGSPFDCTKNLTKGPCILDTGNPGIFMPPEVQEAYVENYDRPETTVIFEIEGFNGGENVFLKFTVGQLRGMYMTGGQGDSTISGEDQISLGWVVWAYYYIVFDVARHSIEFVPKPICKVSDHVTCPSEANNTVICSGAQCCHRDDLSGGQTFPCPSAPVGFNQCESHAKVVNCVQPVLPPSTGINGSFKCCYDGCAQCESDPANSCNSGNETCETECSGYWCPSSSV